MTRRRFLARGGKAALGAGFAGSLLAGCGSGGGGRPGELTYWSGLEGAEQRGYFTRNIEEPFEAAYAGITLETNFQPAAELDRVVRTALLGREGPDIVPTPGLSYAQEYIDANMFKSLDEYAEEYGWEDKMLGWALDMGRREGSLYAIPYQLQTMLLYYNKTLFEENGWTPPKSRDELEGLAEEIMGRGIVPFAAGIGDEPPAVEWFPTVFWNHFSSPEALYQVLTAEIAFSDPIFVEAIDLFNDYVQRGWFGGSRERFFSNGFDSIHAALGNGEAAMNMEGSWFMATIGDFFGGAAGNDNEWDWVPLPPMRDGVPKELYGLGLGSTLSVKHNTQNADEAAAFLNYLVSDTERAAKWMADVPAAFNAPIPLGKKTYAMNAYGLAELFASCIFCRLKIFFSIVAFGVGV
ncbi:MAG: extracellular solute-binding protein [Gemmatimonadota bacterium]|jgi:raffinose/stachyose/melibiose transport system substrate-binding protein|nr:extracellular solute-binding protein [Gemmatimonadota bacterium]